MSVTTYSGLISEVQGWLRRPDISPIVPTFIALAEAQLNRRLRCRAMMSRASLTITSQLTAAPADFAAPRSLRLTSVSPTATLKWVADEQMDQLLDTADAVSGIPRHYTLEGANFRLSPDPGSGPYTASLSYYARLPALSTSAPSNWLLAAHPDAYLYGALAQSAPYLKADERLQTWLSIFGTIIDDINASDTGLGGALEVMPNTYGAGAI